MKKGSAVLGSIPTGTWGALARTSVSAIDDVVSAGTRRQAAELHPRWPESMRPKSLGVPAESRLSRRRR